MISEHVSVLVVCEKYLRQHPEDKDLLWEVEKTGGPHQRTNIASKIQVMDLSGELDLTLHLGSTRWIKGTDLREPSEVLTLSTSSHIPSFSPQLYPSAFHSLKNHM